MRIMELYIQHLFFVVEESTDETKESKTVTTSEMLSEEKKTGEGIKAPGSRGYFGWE